MPIARWPAAQLPLSWTLHPVTSVVTNDPRVSALLNGEFAQPNLLDAIRPHSTYST